MEKPFKDWGSGFCSFVSSFFFFPSMAPAGKYSVWSAEVLLSMLELVASDRYSINAAFLGKKLLIIFLFVFMILN
jgi:hypothetical protein